MKPLNQPLGGNEMPRFGGLASMMRLPMATSAQGLHAGFVGVPLDIGTSHRPGARFGPRQIRAESCLIRPYNMATGAAPFDTLQVADLGDVPINTFNLEKSVNIIEQHYRSIVDSGCIPLTLGGDHTIALPILRSMKARHGPVAMIHVDAHADVNPDMFGERIAHGTPFRCAVEEGLLQNSKVWQIGLRGSGYSAEDFDWPRQQGFTIVPAHEVWYQSLAPLMAGIRATIGGETPALPTIAIGLNSCARPFWCLLVGGRRSLHAKSARGNAWRVRRSRVSVHGRSCARTCASNCAI